jgi:hypothetical protein
VSVLDPAFEKVTEQLPVCEEVSVPVQDSPVLAVTLTGPVGPAPIPAARKLIFTACCTVEELGIFEVIVMLLATLTAVVVCVVDVGAE